MKGRHWALTPVPAFEIVVSHALVLLFAIFHLIVSFLQRSSSHFRYFSSASFWYLTKLSMALSITFSPLLRLSLSTLGFFFLGEDVSNNITS